MAKPVANGSNLFLWNEKGELLVQAMGKDYPTPGLLMWPGGRMNPGERPVQTAAREAAQETGLIVSPHKMRFLGVLAQPPSGLVCICDVREYEGVLLEDKTREIAKREFSSVARILSNRHLFHRSYMYMFISYMRAIRGVDPLPIQGRISEAIEWPAQEDEERFVLPSTRNT